MHDKSIRTLTNTIIITLTAIVGAAVVYFFMMPLGISVGSIPGLALVLGHVIPLQVSTITMILNVLLLTAGALLVGTGFGLKTVYAVALFTGSLAAFERICPAPLSLTGDVFLDMLCYVFLISVCQAVLFSRDTSLGGLDIVAKILNKFLHMDVGQAVSIAGLCVAASSFLVTDTKTAIISVLGTYINGMVVDHFIFGMNPKKRVCIISQKEEEVRDYILNVMGSGASISQTIGAYTNQMHREIITIVDTHEYRQLMSFLERTDPDAFVTSLTVHEVRYRPKPQKRQ